MKVLSLSLLLFVSSLFSTPCKYTITEHPYRFSTYFEMDGEKYEGRVIKSALSVRTVYDLYDESGDFVAQGICRLVSLGSFCAFLKSIDVYDTAGNIIGLIEGALMTTEKASFSFSDGNGKYLGVAYLNLDSSGFNVLDPQEKKIASLKRNFIEGTTDHWDVHIHNREEADLKLLKIFSAFAIDHQEFFKEDK